MTAILNPVENAMLYCGFGDRDYRYGQHLRVAIFDPLDELSANERMQSYDMLNIFFKS